MFEPYEHLDEEGRNEWAIRDHLYAQRRLAELDERATKEKVAKMLAAVVPGPKVCGHISGKEQGRKRCGVPASRMIAITGDWVCAEHDPLGQIHWGRTWPWMNREV